MPAVQHELILGGAKSGKSRTAEERAAAWLALGEEHRATLVATAIPAGLTGDEEMHQRIERHRAERARRLPALQTLEASSALGRTLREIVEPRRIVVVDCLTLWLTQCLLPPLTGDGSRIVPQMRWEQEQAELIAALSTIRSPVVLVSNEIGWGVMPVSREVRSVVDALGVLHQAVAARCARVTLMVAGCALAVKAPDRAVSASAAGVG